MKIQLRKEVVIPPAIKNFIDAVVSSSLPLHESLAGFAWAYDKVNNYSYRIMPCAGFALRPCMLF